MVDRIPLNLKTFGMTHGAHRTVCFSSSYKLELVRQMAIEHVLQTCLVFLLFLSAKALQLEMPNQSPSTVVACWRNIAPQNDAKRHTVAA